MSGFNQNSHSTTGQLKISNSTTTYLSLGYTGSGTFSFYLPTSYGSSGQGLITDGTGNLSWGNVSGSSGSSGSSGTSGFVVFATSSYIFASQSSGYVSPDDYQTSLSVSTSEQMFGFGHTYSAKSTGKILVIAEGSFNLGTSAAIFKLNIRGGTGSAPVSGTGSTGFLVSPLPVNHRGPYSTTHRTPITIMGIADVIQGNDYWFDLSVYASTGTHTYVIYNTLFFIQELQVGVPERYYGNFYDTTTQTNSGATSSNLITFNTTDMSKGVSIQSNSQIKIDYAGIYNIQYSAQIDKTDGGDDEIEIWLRKNGADVANSGSIGTLTGNNARDIMTVNYFVNANAGDYYELVWSSSDVDMRLLARGTQSSPTRPAVPSVILTVDKIN